MDSKITKFIQIKYITVNIYIENRVFVSYVNVTEDQIIGNYKYIFFEQIKYKICNRKS
jgi:hypothetical protein